MKDQSNQSEMDTMLRETMQGHKPDSTRWDEIWSNIREKRAESAARGRRRHLEKIIAVYMCAAAVFVLSITVGASLWSQLPAGNQPVETSDGDTTAFGGEVTTTGDGSAPPVSETTAPDPTTQPTVPDTGEKQDGVLSSSEFTLKIDKKDQTVRALVVKQGEKTVMRVEVLSEDGSVLSSHDWDDPGFITATVDHDLYTAAYFGVFTVTRYEPASEAHVHAHYTEYTVHDGEIVYTIYDDKTGEVTYLPVDAPHAGSCIAAYLPNNSSVKRYEGDIYASYYGIFDKMDWESRIVADTFFADQPYTCSYEESKVDWDGMIHLSRKFFELFVAYAQA